MRDLLGHPAIIVRGFGWTVFFRALRAAFGSRPTTFLACVFGEG